jgi:hypothetical protein
MKDLRRAGLAAALLFAFAPTIARADGAASRTLLFHTSDVDVENGAGDREGSLELRIAPGGGITGNFRPVDSGRLVDVTGSLSGDVIMLFIGWDGPPIVGTLKDGKIDASVLEGDREHRFTAIAAVDRS